MTEEIRKAMRSALDKSGMTQSELAQRAGVKQATVSRYLNGERGKNDEYVKVLEALNLELKVVTKGGE